MRKWILLPFVFIVGCTSLGGKFQKAPTQSKNSALLYVYRPYKLVGAAGKPDLILDGKPIGVVPNGSYNSIPLKPGKHSIAAKGAAYDFGAINFEVVGGKEYFLRVDLTMDKKIKSNAGSVSYVASEFYADNDEIKNILKYQDDKVQKEITNPAFIFIKDSFAEEEIAETKLYTP